MNVQPCQCVPTTKTAFPRQKRTPTGPHGFFTNFQLFPLMGKVIRKPVGSCGLWGDMQIDLSLQAEITMSNETDSEYTQGLRDGIEMAVALVLMEATT